MVQQTSFTTPGMDYGVELGQIERKRALAQALQQQSLQETPQQTAGGMVVPSSPFQGLGKMAQGYAARKLQDKSDLKQRELTGKIQNDYRAMLSKGLGQLQGTPGVPQPSAEVGGGPSMPAQAPDPMGAMATFGSHPMGQQMMPIAMQEMQRQRLANALRGGGMAQGSPQGQPGQMPAGGQPQMAGASGGAGGPAGGLPMEAWLQADATGKTYMEQLAKDQKPIPVSEGGALMGQNGNIIGVRPKIGEGLMATGYGPKGELQGVERIPGFSEAMAGIKGAEEDVKASRDMVTVNTPQGPKMMTRAQAVQMAQGPQSATQQVNQPGQGVGGLMPVNVPEQDMGAWKAVASGQVPAAFGKGGPMPQQKTQAGGGIPLQDPAAQKTDTLIGEGLGKRYNEIQDAGFTANQKINKFSRLGGLLENLNTGKLAPAGYELSAYAKSLGMPVGENLDNAQAAKAVANEIALELRNPSGGAGMPGAMSDADREYLRSMVSGLDKTPGGNKLLVEGMTKLAERDRDIARIAREYKKKTGKFDDGFYDELQAFSEKNPLFKGPAASGQMFAVNPQTKERIVSTDGGQTWKPAQ